MRLPKLASVNDQEMLDEARLIRVALQSIAKSLELVTAIPEPPSVPAEKPIGPEAISEYGASISDMEGEDANAIRERLRAQGLSDKGIEDARVSFLTGDEGDEGL